MDSGFTCLSGWELSNNREERTTSECGGITLVGGYNVLAAGAVASKT